VWHAHEQGPLAGNGAGVIEAGSGRARSAEQRSGERRGGPVRWAPFGRERGHVGHAWNMWVGRGEGRSWGGPERTMQILI
jgi:hypothetical protein